MKKLIEAVKQHQALCRSMGTAASFGIKEMNGVAPGILIVCETDGEHTIYFDKSILVTRKDAAYEDISGNINGFPKGIGFIEDITSRDLKSIKETAQLFLKNKSGKAIKWYKKPKQIS